jgi:hypothetical protein
MVEGSWEPGSGGVAGTTIRPKLTTMRIILGMTGDTSGVKFSKDIINVAL